ncbi:MAG: UvrD-helicase domain-containing protein [bacterium]
MHLDENQQRAVDFYKGQVIVIAAAGSGKCLGKDTPVLMFDGFTKVVQDIRPGDSLMGPDSRPRVVLSVTNGIDRMYRIVPTKGVPWVCNESHILTLAKKHGGWVDIPLNEYLKRTHNCNGKTMFEKQHKLFRIGIDFPEQDVDVDPYIMGLWLGDGDTLNPCFTTEDREIEYVLFRFAQLNRLPCKTTYDKRRMNVMRISLAWHHRSVPNVFKAEIRKFVVKGIKRIPRSYLLNSRSMRLRLLAGLIDSDGYYNNGYYEIATKRTELKDDIVFLARSLGYYVHARPKVSTIKSTGFIGLYWRIGISGDFMELPCRIERKKPRVRLQVKDVLRIGFVVEPIGYGEYFGFELSGDGRFLLGDFTVTHNTRCTTERIKKLVERGESPESILAFTFTNAAADEMKKRLLVGIGDAQTECLNIGTMHSQLNKILRANIQFWKPHMHKYEIMQDYEQRKLIQEALKMCGLPEDSLVNIANAARGISWVKNQALSVDDIESGLMDELLSALGIIGWFVDFFKTYEVLREDHRYIGFDDMLWQTYFLMRDKVNILNTYAEKFKFLLVDEFQDTNRVQFKLIEMLQSKHKNLFVVGDPRQAVFGFRGADVTLSLEFQKHFPKAELIELLHNYRSASNIVEMGNDLIANAQYPFQRTQSTRGEGKISFTGSFMEDNAEAYAITDEIKALYTDGAKYGDIIVLTRTNAQSRPFEEAFVKNKIPYRALDGTFYESANVKDMVAYLSLITGDSIEGFRRVYNKPNRFLGKVFLESFEYKSRGGASFIQTLSYGGFPKPYMNKSASTFAAELKLIRGSCSGANPGKAISMIRKMFGYDDWLKKNEVDASNRIEMLNELQSSAEAFTDIQEYLDFVKNLIAAQSSKDDYDAVRIMTIHRSKGLESPIVFVAGVSEGVLPHARAEDIQEERRLCYVAVTRAIDRVYVSYYLVRFNKKLAPSRFLQEMVLDKYSGQEVTVPIELAVVEN